MNELNLVEIYLMLVATLGAGFAFGAMSVAIIKTVLEQQAYIPMRRTPHFGDSASVR